MLKSFKPAVNANSKILILGTMPGEASLKAGQYYAYAHNHFWKIIFTLFAKGQPALSYQDKLALLAKNKIALWDSLASCSREGSLDSNIKSEVPNKIPALLKKHPDIKKILFNGQASFKYFKKHFGAPALPYQIMPSTSPANARLPFEAKLSLWKEGFKDIL